MILVADKEINEICKIYIITLLFPNITFSIGGTSVLSHLFSEEFRGEFV